MSDESMNRSDGFTISVKRPSTVRSWLRALPRRGSRQWQPLDLTFKSDGTIHFTPISSTLTRYSNNTNLGPALQLIPGGARRATHSEQIAQLRNHLFVLVTIPADGSNRGRLRRSTHMCSADSHADANRAVEFAAKTSFAAMGGIPFPIAGPLLHAWGTRRTLPLPAVVDAAADIGFSISQRNFRALYEDKMHQKLPSDFSISNFISLMTCVAMDAVRESLEHVASSIPSSLSSSSTSPKNDQSIDIGTDLMNADTAAPKLYALFHSDNSVVDPVKMAKEHDMTFPLNDYLISSSHNTYLSGDQLQSESSAEMYRLALEKGCRCVEIDAWNGDNGQPVVTHGHTMTSDEPLEKVLTVISEHAFRYGNHCPVIISLENHLDVAQQQVAASQFQKVFGDTLYSFEDFIKYTDSSSSSSSSSNAIDPRLAPLPSPHALQNRFILKTKSARPVVQQSHIDNSSGANSEDIGSDSFDSEDSVEDDAASGDSDRRSSGESSNKPSKPPKQPNGGKKSKRGVKIIEQLDRKVLISNGNRKALLSHWKRRESGTDIYVPTSCISLDERRMEDAYEKLSKDVIRSYNKHALTRVYPKGMRIGSSNYTPTMAHSLGCQIVALNWQRHDSALAVNEARFLSNNNCGYVLASSVQSNVNQRPVSLKLQILCGLMLPIEHSRHGDVGDPYCVVKLYDEVFNDDDDFSCFKFETGKAKNNSFVPVWNASSPNIPVQNPRLAVLNMKVYDRDRTSGDDLIGYCAVPIALLRTGLRCFPLKSKKGDVIELPGTGLQPSVLCHVTWCSQGN